MAFEQLKIAQQLYSKDVWFRWRYNLRNQTELANYWFIRGELDKAKQQALQSLKSAEKTSSRKYIAFLKKVLGDIAFLEDRVKDAKNFYNAAITTFTHHPCPTVEWKILKAAADLEKLLRNDAKADEYRRKAKAVVQSLADNVVDEKLRKIFLLSKVVRELKKLLS